MTSFKMMAVTEEVLSDIEMDKFPNHAFQFMHRKPIMDLCKHVIDVSRGRLAPYIETLRLNPKIYSEQNPVCWNEAPAVFFLGESGDVRYAIDYMNSHPMGHEDLSFRFGKAKYFCKMSLVTQDGYIGCLLDTKNVFRPEILAKFGDKSRAII